jgi:hypothetical protein
MLKKSILFLGTVLAISSSMFIGSAAAGHIKIVNENKKPIKIKIVPVGKGTNKVEMKDLPGDHFYEFDVTPQMTQSKTRYAIEGETHVFLGDTCKNLSVEENYQVTFTDDVMGTTCLAEKAK